MYSSTTGIIPSLIIAGLVLVFSWRMIAHSNKSNETGSLGGSHALGASAASFAAAFSVLNLALQWQVVDPKFIGQEV